MQLALMCNIAQFTQDKSENLLLKFKFVSWHWATQMTRALTLDVITLCIKLCCKNGAACEEGLF